LSVVEHIKSFLEPKSIAIIGVPRQVGTGSNVLENLLWYGYKGQLFPVNPRAQEILGIKCYPLVRALPGVVDLAIIQTGSKIVPAVVQDCVDRGIKAIIIQTDGFAELSSEGKGLQEQILSIARSGGARILGPNTFGVINTFRNLATPFAQFNLKKSAVSAISQSGIFSTGYLYGIPLGKVIDLGNACDIGFCEALEYLAQDDDTKIILLHIEGIKNARYFGEVAAKTSREKPIIAIQGGKSQPGAKLMGSHSGSLGGRQEIIEAALHQYGIIQTEDLEEMKDMTRALLALPPMAGNGLAIMTYTMGGAVMFLDACQQYGLTLAQLSDETTRKIKTLLPRLEALANPVDLMPFFQVDSTTANEAYKKLLYGLLSDKSVNALVLISASFSPIMEVLVPIITQVRRDFPQKPMVSWIWGPGQENLGNIGQFNYMSANSAARALNVLRSVNRNKLFRM